MDKLATVMAAAKLGYKYWTLPPRIPPDQHVDTSTHNDGDEGGLFLTLTNNMLLIVLAVGLLALALMYIL